MSTLPSRRPPHSPHASGAPVARLPVQVSSASPMEGVASASSPAALAPHTAFTITWTLAPAALRRARPDLDLPARGADLSLVWTIHVSDPDAQPAADPSAHVALQLDGRPLPFDLTSDALVAEIEHDREQSVTHIRVAGLLEATLDAATGRTLYAHTTLLAALLLPGGTYRLRP